MSSVVNNEDVRSRILRVSRELFIREGYASVSIRRIASLSGTNVAHISYYFGSKHGLFEVIFADAFEVLLGRVMGVIGSDLPILEMIGPWVTVYYEVLLEYPQIPLFIINEINRNSDELVLRLRSRIPVSMYDRLSTIQTEKLRAAAEAERKREAEQRAASERTRVESERLSHERDLRDRGVVLGDYVGDRLLRDGVLACPKHVGVEEGYVVLEILIDRKGKVVRAEVSDGSQEIDITKSSSIRVSGGTTIDDILTHERAIACALGMRFSTGFGNAVGLITYCYGIPEAVSSCPRERKR
jgi:AcrR family transcriptional regulator